MFVRQRLNPQLFTALVYFGIGFESTSPHILCSNCLTPNSHTCKHYDYILAAYLLLVIVNLEVDQIIWLSIILLYKISWTKSSLMVFMFCLYIHLIVANMKTVDFMTVKTSAMCLETEGVCVDFKITERKHRKVVPQGKTTYRQMKLDSCCVYECICLNTTERVNCACSNSLHMVSILDCTFFNTKLPVQEHSCSSVRLKLNNCVNIKNS